MKKRLLNLGKILIIILVVFIAILFIGIKTPFFLSDLRPDKLKSDYILQNNGRFYVEQSQKAHGIVHWKNQDSITYKINHEFPGKFAAILISPNNGSLIEYQYMSNPQNRMASYFQSTASQPSFLIGADEKGIFKEDGHKKIYEEFSTNFFYKGIRHLIEFPFEMESANILEYVGEEQWNGNSYDLVFATWNNIDLSMEMDHYIIWINKQTKLIDRFDATGRGITPFAKAKVLFEYTHLVDSIFLPKTINVFSVTSGEKPLMNLKIEDITFSNIHDGEMIKDSLLQE